MEDENIARVPRIPRATEACPHPLTLDQLCEWKKLWAMKRRPRTQSGHDDYSECDRQFLDPYYASSTESYDSDSEEERIQARRSTCQRPLSPPRTPPHLRGPELYKNQDIGLAPRTDGSKVEKTKSKSRTAPRRPYTRSRGAPAVSLHHRKGQIVYWRVPWKYTIICYDQYLKDFVILVPH